MSTRSPRAPFSMRLSVEGEVRRKGRWYVARCPIFDVVTQGESQSKALENMQDALREFFLSCFERGTIDEVLKSAGLMPVSECLPRSHKSSARDRRISLQIELPLVQRVPVRGSTNAHH